MIIKEANDIDMVSYLSVIGFEPAKPKGISYSPDLCLEITLLSV